MNKFKRVNILAPAKINLYLYVLHRRSDGYHEIVSLMVPVSLFDLISISQKQRGIEVSCDGNFKVPEGEENIAFRAADLFFQHYSLSGGVKIEIDKNIPVSSGLGGGSSDAAAVLKGLSLLFLGEMRAGDLMGLAPEIGSDVPFFIFPGPSVVAGRGEKVKKIRFGKRFHVLIVKPDVSVSTKAAYRMLDRGGEPVVFDCPQPDMINSLGDLEGFLRNDFEDVIFQRYPELGVVKERLLALGAGAALLSGSGSSVFGLYERKEDGERAQKDFDGNEGFFSKLVSNF
ncbi:MAG: 4-(cytidine 5'-diphospho)-2-C-methyl-D-erythritol kinase [Deltaproteobacteria bacterium]|nr:4-(cytidine 5'-diphospho)-2-C-methyl-D-erythritol kinase [Deltaproteobacteria bacterium]NIS77467.1 4-(cytidine 5'-diphospho)-2-C-methyl-D-erythritol kinase [Deltaproteobacteria bacterium]